MRATIAIVPIATATPMQSAAMTSVDTQNRQLIDTSKPAIN
jgi:hypothetical protein